MIIVACEGVIMLKYQFDYLANTLAYQENDIWHQIAEERQFTTNFGQPGFKLDNGSMTFSIYEKKITVFAKQTDQWGYATHYRKYLNKEVPATFTLTEQDEVHKINGQWRRRYD